MSVHKLRSNAVATVAALILGVWFVRPAAPHEALRPNNIRIAEEEIFGEVFDDGAKVNDTYTVQLTPLFTPTPVRGDYVDSEIATTANGTHMFGWYEDATSQCDLQSEHHATPTIPQLHGPAASRTSDYHCVHPGQYTIAVGGRSFKLDYVPAAKVGGYQVVTGNGELVTPWTMDSAMWDPDYYNDAILDFDFNSSGFSDSPSLYVDKTSDPFDNFSGSKSVSGAASAIYRFDASGSSSNWTASGAAGTGMMGHLWSKVGHGGSWNELSGYYTVGALPILRAFTFTGHSNNDTIWVALEIMRPDEDPNTSFPGGDSVSIVITGSEPSPNAFSSAGLSQLPQSVERNSAFVLTAGRASAANPFSVKDSRSFRSIVSRNEQRRSLITAN